MTVYYDHYAIRDYDNSKCMDVFIDNSTVY